MNGLYTVKSLSFFLLVRIRRGGIPYMENEIKVSYNKHELSIGCALIEP